MCRPQTLKWTYPTWDNITKANGSHGDEAEVETIKEGPVLPEGEKEGSTTKEDTQEDKGSSYSVHVVTKPHLIIFFIILSKINRFERSKLFMVSSLFCLGLSCEGECLILFGISFGAHRKC